MNILTATCKVPQLRCLPVDNARPPAPLRYAVNLAGEWVPINHSFAHWSVEQITHPAKRGG